MRVCVFVLAGLLVAGCSGGGNGGSDGGQTKCGSSWCAASEICLGEAVCVSRATQTARACEEEHDNIFREVEDANLLSCHNVEACPTESCPGALACRGGTCGIPAPSTAGLPEKVIYRGCVDAFGIGDTTSGMNLALYRAGADLEGTPGWQVVTTEDKTSCEYWGAFEFSDVPTNTPLVLKSWDNRDNFVKVYKHNLVLWADLAVQQGNDWVFDTRSQVTDPRTGLQISLDPWRGYAISSATYNVILMAVGVDLGANEGAIAGTVRDCHYRETAQVRCGVSPPAQIVTYFSNAENPRPELNRKATNLNGIYAAIGVTSGVAKLACTAQDAGGALVPLGIYNVQVLPHAISVLSFDWYPAVP